MHRFQQLKKSTKIKSEKDFIEAMEVLPSDMNQFNFPVKKGAFYHMKKGLVQIVHF